ncbi:ATP-binding cassette transporter snq2, partial [Coemansia sp. 'formosensis']
PATPTAHFPAAAAPPNSNSTGLAPTAFTSQVGRSPAATPPVAAIPPADIPPPTIPPPAIPPVGPANTFKFAITPGSSGTQTQTSGRAQHGSGQTGKRQGKNNRSHKVSDYMARVQQAISSKPPEDTYGAHGGPERARFTGDYRNVVIQNGWVLDRRARIGTQVATPYTLGIDRMYFALLSIAVKEACGDDDPSEMVAQMRELYLADDATIRIRYKRAARTYSLASIRDVNDSALEYNDSLEFTLQCKTPSRRVLQDRMGYGREFLNTLLDMYSLTDCANTIVVNAFLRGMSGGERKRVSIAEQVASGASIDIWDGSTKGLDTISALDYVQSLHITTDVLHKSTVVTIYQASENIYRLFDKVMAIDESRQLYFGPASEAVAYFCGLGIDKPLRQTTSNLLTGVTQLHERKVIAVTAEDFERAWLKSGQCQTVKQNVVVYEAQLERDGRSAEICEFVDQTKMGTSSSRLRRQSPCTMAFIYQLVRLLKQEWEILLGSNATIICKLAFNASFTTLTSTLLFEQFEFPLLLVRGGHAVYFGDLGTNAVR